MSYLSGNDIRNKYLSYFKKKNHIDIFSSSLIPENDSSLLFTNSGMFPLVPYLLGEKHPAGKRLMNSQKCFRAEDIDEIGDARHNTFFEMLGNWSLGDYFKKEQLEWWYDFLFTELKLDPRKTYCSVYAGNKKIDKDEESIKILQNIFKKYNINAEEGPATVNDGTLGSGQEIDFSKQRIFAYRDKNWWQRGDAIGELGGPDSETFYDTGKKHDPKFGSHCHINCDCGRFLEIGNSVFMQYQKTVQGWTTLKNKNVDFGGGLERLTMIVQNKNNIYETDLFINIITKISELSGKKYSNYNKFFEIIADHLKAATFIMGDDKGVPPSNTDQGYIVRRLIRRAIRYGRQLDIVSLNWTSEIAQIIINDYIDIYPELNKNKDYIISELAKEESKFKRTIEKGEKKFTKFNHNLTGEEAFNLYQSYGFPIEMTVELAKEKGLSVDEIGFQKELKKHQETSRAASANKFKSGLADTSLETTKLHTATHLLHAALRKILGNHVEQKGSNITAERLRFDFSHSEKMTPEQITAVENLVNIAINNNYPISFTEMTVAEAKKNGAIGLFENRYTEKIKVYTIGNPNNSVSATADSPTFSREICSGPHVKNTKILGKFKITKESSAASGVRRIKAILE